jgi:threonine synthase
MVLFSNALYCLLYRADIELFVFSPSNISPIQEAIEGMVKQHQEDKEGRGEDKQFSVSPIQEAIEGIVKQHQEGKEGR